MKYFLLLNLAFFLLISCTDMEEEITWKTKNIPAKAVVEGSIISDTCYQLIRLSKTGDYFLNEQTPRISGAEVTVTDGTRIYQFIESDTVAGDYYSVEKFAGIPGNNYTLNVSLPEAIEGTSTLTASDELIQGFKIDSLKVYVFENPFLAMEEKDSTVLIYYMNGSQPPNVTNYYLIQIYRNDSAIFENITEMELYNDEYSEDPEETEFIAFFVLNSVIGDTLSIDLTAISKGYFEYIRTLKEIASPPDVFGFSGPPADAIGNVNMGTQLGYFYSGQKSRATAIARKPEGF